MNTRLKTSEELIAGHLYTRAALQQKFGIKDATIRTGIFRPRGHDSIWLFITKEKSGSQTQYRDELKGDDLYIEGQTAGLKDNLLITHEKSGLEVLLFFRERIKEHPNAAFRYEGTFRYVDHKGTRPAQFHFRRIF